MNLPRKMTVTFLCYSIMTVLDRGLEKFIGAATQTLHISQLSNLIRSCFLHGAPQPATLIYSTW
jgi:hypothetical protein